MRDILLLVGVSIAAFIGLVRPSFGVLTYAFLGVFSPQSLTWGFARTLPFSQVAAISTIVGMFISSERKVFPAQREIALLILFWGFMAFSTWFALYPDDALESYIYVSKVFLMIVVTTILINSKDKLHSLIRVIGLSLGFYGLKGGVFALASGGSMMVFGPDNSFLSANNSIGLALAMNIPILLYLIKQEASARLRWLIKAMLVFSYPAIVCTYSRGAWMGMVAATALSVIKSRNKFLMIGVTGVLTMFLVTIVPKIAPENLVHRYDDLVNYDKEDSAQSRFWNWEFCKRVGLGRPLGGGFNFYNLEVYEQFYPEFQARWPGKVWSCHSMWLTILGEQGILGTIIWVSLIASCMISLARMSMKSRGSSDEKYLIDFTDMIKSSMVTYFVVGTFLDAAYFDLFYYFVAFVVIQKGILARTVKSTDPAIVRRDLGLAGETRNHQRAAPNYS